MKQCGLPNSTNLPVRARRGTGMRTEVGFIFAIYTIRIGKVAIVGSINLCLFGGGGGGGVIVIVCVCAVLCQNMRQNKFFVPPSKV